MRTLVLVHRWIGVVLALFFAMWFASGVVMMYVPYPRLTEAERLASAPPLDLAAVRVTPADALATADITEWPRRLRLGMHLDRPVYRILPMDGAWITVYADDGTRAAAPSAEDVRRIAARFAGVEASGEVEALVADQWTVTTGFIRPHRPLYKVALGDGAGTELYVSTRSLEVIRDTTRAERFWNWLGAVPHWIYPTVLRERPELWRDVVIWLSAAGSLGAVTGLAVGIARLRPAGYRNGRASPYRGWMLWHHLLGLGAALFVLTWIVSGLVSMNPGRLFTAASADDATVARLRGTVDDAMLAQPPAACLREAGAATREAELAAVSGRAYWIARAPGEAPRVLREGSERPFEPDALGAAAARLLDAPLAAIDRIEAFDAYWYTRHEPRALPVLRVRVADAAQTWFHVDARTGELLGRMDATRRAYRWLFNALHSLDFPGLYARRPLWDAVVIALCALGFAASVTGLIIGWRRLFPRRRVAVDSC